MRIPIILIGALFFVQSSLAQNREMDSLNIVLRSQENKVNKGDAYQRLSWLLMQSDTKTAEAYLDTAEVIYKQIEDLDKVAMINYKRAVLHRLKGHYKIGISYIDKNIEYLESQGDTLMMGHSLFQKAVLLKGISDYEGATMVFYETIDIYEAYNQTSLAGMTLNSLAGVYKRLGKTSEAEKTYLRALEIHTENKDSARMSTVFRNLGSIEYNKKNLDKALEYFEKSLPIEIARGSISGRGVCNDYIGHIYIERKDFETGIKYLKKAASFFVELKYQKDHARSLVGLGKAYRLLNDYSNSEAYLIEAEKIGTESLEIRKKLYDELYLLYKDSNNHKKSLSYLEKRAIASDSLYLNEDLESINELQTKYETEKKEKEIARQDLVIQKGKSKNQILGILIGSILFGSLLLWWSFYQRQRRLKERIRAIEKEKEVLTLESLIKGEESERLRIAQELHDGLNGDLSAIKFKLASLQQKNSDAIDEVIGMIDASCNQVRTISHDLAPPALKHFSLIEAIDDFCSSKNAIHDEQVTFQNIGEDKNLDKQVELNIYRIVQELVTNAIQHAQATNIDVQLSMFNDIVQLTVEDDGIGMSSINEKNFGIGLGNIEMRLEYLKGQMDTVTNEHGTSITINFEIKS